jgi:hypothetical protein
VNATLTDTGLRGRLRLPSLPPDGARRDRFRAIFHLVAKTFLVAWRRLEDLPEG